MGSLKYLLNGIVDYSQQRLQQQLRREKFKSKRQRKVGTKATQSVFDPPVDSKKARSKHKKAREEKGEPY